MKNQKEITTTLQRFYENPVAKVSLELVLSLTLIIFFSLFAIRPTLLTMSDLVKEIEEKKELDAKLSQKVSALSSAQVEYLTLQPRLPLLDEALPQDPNLLKTLKIIEKTASDNRIIIENLNVIELPPEKVPAAEQAGTPLTTPSFEQKDLPITVSVTGSYPAIRQFVEDLKISRRTFIIDTIVFSAQSNRNRASLKATITLLAPYFGAGS